jgi:hypothetical protein
MNAKICLKKPFTEKERFQVMPEVPTAVRALPHKITWAQRTDVKSS